MKLFGKNILPLKVRFVKTKFVMILDKSYQMMYTEYTPAGYIQCWSQNYGRNDLLLYS